MDITEGQPAKTYIKQLCVNSGCHVEELPGEMTEGQLAEKVMGIHANSTT